VNRHFVKKHRRTAAFAIILCFGGLFFLHKSGTLVFSRPVWSIGICEGESPFILNCSAAHNPVLTGLDVTGFDASFVGDPFMIHDADQYFMFFEVMNSTETRASIGLATSANGDRWKYRRIVLAEPFTLSYPYVFKWDDNYYMVPESSHANAVRLYRAKPFPDKWDFVANLVTGRALVDPTIVRVDDRWWLFSAEGDDTLRLYYADRLTGPWVEHPKSPIVSGDPTRARPGGRALLLNGRLFRVCQDDTPRYGRQVRVFEVMELSAREYKETELRDSPILGATGLGWNRDGMHTVDSLQKDESHWLACVDGLQLKRTVRLRWPFSRTRRP
jgi:hypothetical protein